MKKNLKIIILVAVVLIIGIVAVVLARAGKLSPKADTLGPSLTISPSSGNYALNDTVNLSINVDTAGQAVDGVDVVNLNYPADKMELQSLTPGNIFNLSVVTQAGGVIAFVATVPQGTSGYTGSGLIATANFKVVASGTADLTFDFTPGSTRDCNIAEHGTGVDILSSVINGDYLLGGATPTPTETTTPTPTPTPTPTESMSTINTTPPSDEVTPTPVGTPTAVITPVTTPTAKTVAKNSATPKPSTSSQTITPGSTASQSSGVTVSTSPELNPTPAPTASAKTRIGGFKVSSTLAGVIAVVLALAIIVLLVFKITRKKKNKSSSSDRIDDDLAS